MQEQINRIAEETERQKKIIAEARDKLRELHNDLETCLESFDTGSDWLDEATDALRYGLESLSEHV